MFLFAFGVCAFVVVICTCVIFIYGIVTGRKRKAAMRRAARRHFMNMMNCEPRRPDATFKVQYQEGPASQGGEEGEGHEAYTGNRVGY